MEQRYYIVRTQMHDFEMVGTIKEARKIARQFVKKCGYSWISRYYPKTEAEWGIEIFEKKAKAENKEE